MSEFADPTYSSADYARFRPDYPQKLYDEIFRFMGRDPGSHKESGSLAVDVGTGTGQAAAVLCRYFDRVIGTDSSEGQLKHAANAAENITYVVATAEELAPVPSASADLVTVAQAAHWFDAGRFHEEVDRVLKPGGTLAVFGYLTRSVGTPAVTAVVNHFRKGTVAEYWEPGRAFVEDEYDTLSMPTYARQSREKLIVRRKASVATFMDYVSTFSAYKSWLKGHPDDGDVLADLKARIMAALGTADESTIMDVDWVFFLLLAEKPPRDAAPEASAPPLG